MESLKTKKKDITEHRGSQGKFSTPQKMDDGQDDAIMDTFSKSAGKVKGDKKKSKVTHFKERLANVC